MLFSAFSFLKGIITRSLPSSRMSSDCFSWSCRRDLSNGSSIESEGINGEESCLTLTTRMIDYGVTETSVRESLICPLSLFTVPDVEMSESLVSLLGLLSVVSSEDVLVIRIFIFRATEVIESIEVAHRLVRALILAW